MNTEKIRHLLYLDRKVREGFQAMRSNDGQDKYIEQVYAKLDMLTGYAMIGAVLEQVYEQEGGDDDA